MKDRCNKTDRRGFAARLLRGVIRTCFLISPIIIAQTALGQTQNIFYPEQITVTAGNNAIREIPDNVVWLTGGDCKITEEKTDIDTYPISTASADTFRLEVKMHTCQGLPINFLEGLFLNWDIQGTGLAGGRSFGSKPGSTDSIWYVDLPTPKAVGEYILNLELVMLCCSNAPSYSLSRNLFVTKYPNHSSTTPLSAIGIPKREWYEKAVPWVQGAEGEGEVLEKLLQQVYSYGSRWLYDGEAKCRDENGSLGQQDITWDKLIDDSDSCKNGDCNQFSMVFENLARVLGIDGMRNETTIGRGRFHTNPNTGKRSPWPFVTVPGIASLDPAFIGNTRLQTAGSPFDRYTFATHNRRLRNGKYYDATFNLISSSEYEFVEFNTNGTETPPGGGKYYFTTLEGARLYWLSESVGPQYARWGAQELELPASPFKAAPRAAESVVSVTSSPTFSNVTFRTESGGVYATALVAEIQALLPDPESYVIYGVLKKDGEAIVGISAYDSVAPTFVSIMGGDGIHDFELRFSGEEIYLSGEDGPYTLELYADIVSAAFETPAYVHTDFGEVKVRIELASEELADNDGNGLYDELVIKTNLAVREAGPFDLHGVLLDGDKTISVATLSLDLPVGASEVNLVFPGEPIGDNAGTHEYAVVLSLLNLEGPNQNSFVYTPAPIESTDFESFLQITGDIEDEGYDRDGDGLLDELRIVFNAQVESSGTYTFSGVLSDPNGAEFAYASRSYTMTAGTPVRIELGFSYLRINAQEEDGPFSIDDVLLMDADGRTVDRATLNYTTGDYAYTDFEPAYTITFGNALSEQLTDADKNCLADTLTVYLPVISTRDGMLEVSGDLHDADGKKVARGTGSASVSGGIPAALPISFDGRYLYGSLQDDTFELRNVVVYPQSDYSQTAHLDTPLETESYNYLDFEPAAVVTGTIHNPDVVGAYAVGALVYSGGVSDTADDNGYYRLVFLDEASKTLRVSYSANPGAVWQVYVGDSFIAEQNFASITSEIGVVQTVDFRSRTQL